MRSGQKSPTFVIAMPLTRRQALLQSVATSPPSTPPHSAKRPRQRPPTNFRNKQPASTPANVKHENSLHIESKRPRIKSEPIPKPEPLLYNSTKPEPHQTSIKPEQHLHHDIEDVPPYLPPSSSITLQVTNRLRNFYRERSDALSHPKTQPRPLLDSLIATILSQATSNVNSSRAFANLKRAFPTWQHALVAGAQSVEDAIRCGGLAAQKSVVIVGVLDALKKERDEMSLEYLRDMNDHEVKKELCRFKGVGPKTAACVLMFGMRRAEFPVDTHVRRLASRLGWMPLNATAEKTYDVLNACVPDDIKYDLHVLLIEHGRKTCKSQRPSCTECPLADICPAAGVVKEGNEKE